MTGGFQREDRYVVMKRADLDAAVISNKLTQRDLDSLNHILGVLRDTRETRKKPRELKCVVVESTWPEHERVWAMLEERIGGGQA